MSPGLELAEEEESLLLKESAKKSREKRDAENTELQKATDKTNISSSQTEEDAIAFKNSEDNVELDEDNLTISSKTCSEKLVRLKSETYLVSK